MATNDTNTILNSDLTKFKKMFPELTNKQLKVVFAYTFFIKDNVVAQYYSCTTDSLYKLRLRACNTLGIKERDLRSVVAMRTLLLNNLM